ncbi:hypothetical protein D3C76_1597630 [compost metagenome]
MQDRVHAIDQLIHGVFVGEVAGHDFFAIINGRGDVGDVRQANDIGVRAQALAQDFAQATGGTGQQQAIEGRLGGCSGCHGNSWTSSCYYWVVVGCRTTKWEYR